MKMRAFFSHDACLRGDENPRTGFDNWRQPVGQTESIANRLPAGRAKRVNPPLTAIFKMRARTKVRAFFFWIAPGDSNLETPCAHYVGWRCAYPTYKKLLFHHPRILFGQKIYQRPDRRQHAAPRRINCVNHFPSGFPRVQHPYQFS